jgi:SAM-dependent methyltransferase
MIPAWMTRQIGAAQNAFLVRILNDPGFLERAAAHVQHAHLATELPRNGGHVLELGCGPGKYVAMLARLGFDVTGVDPFTFPTWDAIRAVTNATLMDGVRAEALPFPDRHFDHVVCLGTLLYVQDPARALAEMRRVLKPGGKLIVRTVNRNNLYSRRTRRPIDPSSKNLFSLDELATDISSAGFTVERSFAYGLFPPWLPNFWWYLTSVWFPIWVQDVLSALVPEPRRWNNTVIATVTR